MTFEFTICRVAEKDKIAAKRITPTTTVDYDLITWWRYEPAVETSLEGMAERLRALALQPRRMIVMGSPIDGLNLREAHRRRWADPDTATLCALARSWLPLDIDGVAVPKGLGRAKRLEAAAVYVRDNLLPEEFAGVRMIVTPTASTGRKGDDIARFRFFVALDQAHPLATMKQWARAAAGVLDLPLDSSVIQGGQPVYTPRPIFEGVEDTVPRALHAIILDGDRDLAPLVVDRFAVGLAKIEAKIEQAVRACRRDWRALMDETIGGEESFFIPLTRSIGFAVRAGATAAEIETTVTTLITLRADADRRAQYDRSWIARTIASFQNRDDVLRADHKRTLSQIFNKRAIARWT